MKRCPHCRRDYYDDSLMYCLDDGNVLLEGPAVSDPRTLVLTNSPDSASPWTTPRPVDQPTQILRLPASFERPTPNCIAVLPFANIGSDPDIDYFSDGLAEELLNVLSKIRGLRVAARTSSFSFKDKRMTVSEIGNALQVSSIVQGSIRMAGRRMRISVQLVKVEDGFQLWSEAYDRTMDDIFAVQDDIARCVVEEVRSRVMADGGPAESGTQILREVAAAVKGRSANPEAQRLLMLGRHFLDRTMREDAVKAITHFREAVDLDPNFALCWAELGRAYSVQTGKAWLAVDEGFQLSLDATERSLTLEPDLAEAHAQMGRIRAVFKWDLVGALASYSRALELAPGNTVVMDGASVLEYKLGNIDRAIELSHQVLAQDPLSGAVWHNLGLFSYCAGLLQESETAFRRALELNPQRIATPAMLALVLADAGRMAEAFEMARTEPDVFWRLWALAILHWLDKEVMRADSTLAEILAIASDGDIFQIAEIYAVRGETDKAFDWLQRAADARDTGVTHMYPDPRFRSLHADPRWQELLHKTGFAGLAEGSYSKGD